MKKIKIQIYDTKRQILFQQIESFTQKSAPRLIYEGSDDLYQALMTSTFNFNMLVNDGADGKFFHLYTGSENRFRVEVKDENNKLIWRGFLLPDMYNEPYHSPTFFVDMIASDGLGILRGRELDTSFYKEENAVIDIIIECLKLTGLRQNLYFSPGIFPANGYTWDQIFVDGKIWKEEDDKKIRFFDSDTDKKKSAYEILESLVHDIGCTLYSWGGNWYCEGINRKRDRGKTHYKYNYKGEMQGIYYSITNVRDIVFVGTPLLQILSPWKKVEVTADLDEDKEIIHEKHYVMERFGDLAITHDPRDLWKEVGLASAFITTKESKMIVEWNHGDLLPNINIAGERVLAVSKRGGVETPQTLGPNYIELKNPIYIAKSTNSFDLVSVSLNMELFASDISITKQRFEALEFANSFRYEIIFGQFVVASSFPNSPLFDDGGLKINFSEGSTRKDADLPKGERHIVSRPRLTAKVKIPYIGITGDDFLNIRIYPPVQKNHLSPAFDYIGISALEMKLKKENKYFLSRIRNIDYTTKYNLDLFHIDNAQDNTNKKFRLKRNGVTEYHAARQKWARWNQNEALRFGDVHARIIHDTRSSPSVKVDGRAIGIFNPTELLSFFWRTQRCFIPTRLTLDFSENRTDITMLEDVYQNVTDYTYGLGEHF